MTEEMDEKFGDLDPGKAQQIADTLASQYRRAFKDIAKLDKKLTNTNFLLNGGGAAAVLGFIGSGIAPDGAKWILLCFVIGLIATGFEIRSMLVFYRKLFEDALRRHQGFLNGKLRVKDCLVAKDIAKSYRDINHWSGWVSQLSFIAGVVIGAVMFICQSA